MIIVTGSEGMLGRNVVSALEGLKQKVQPLAHRQLDIADLAHVTRLSWGKGDTVINCAGVIKDIGEPLAMVQANVLGPQVLAHAARQHGFRLIHISTDCVFANLDRGIAPRRFRDTNQAAPEPRSLYGRTKLAGEPSGAGVTVIRTSFAGPDHGLWQWLRDVDYGVTVSGWRNAWWSGSTVQEVAKTIAINVNNFPSGVVHLATPKPITKLDACKELITFLGRFDLRVEPSGEGTDRSLEPTPPYILRPFAEALHG